jgi:hypothetical protein
MNAARHGEVQCELCITQLQVTVSVSWGARCRLLNIVKFDQLLNVLQQGASAVRQIDPEIDCPDLKYRTLFEHSYILAFA